MPKPQKEILSQNQSQDETLTQMEKILRRQAELDVLRPAGSQKYRDWSDIFKSMSNPQGDIDNYTC